MHVAGLLSSAAPIIKSYRIGATVIADAPVLIDAAGNGGVVPGTTTSAANMVGIALNAGTYTTVQGTGSSSADVLVKVIINPDAIIEMLMSGGATEGTALTQYAVTTASAGGTAITTASEWSSPTYDEGAVWGYDGANTGQLRKITSVSSTAGTVVVPFDYATVVGDNFLRAPYWPGSSSNIQLTTNLTQADASIAVGTGAEFKVIELKTRDKSDTGTTESKLYALANSHVFE